MQKLIIEIEAPIECQPKDISKIQLFIDKSGATHSQNSTIRPILHGYDREKIDCPFQILSIQGRHKIAG